MRWVPSPALALGQRAEALGRSFHTHKVTRPLAARRTQQGSCPIQVPACLASACLGCIRISDTHLQLPVSFRSVVRQPGSSSQGGRRGGSWKLSSDPGVAQLCVLFAPWPEADPSRSSPPPPTRPTVSHVCTLEPWWGLGGPLSPVPAAAVSGVLLLIPDHALSHVKSMGDICNVPVSSAPSPHSVVLWGLLLPQTQHSPVRQPNGLIIAWPSPALKCWNPRLPSQVFLLRWQ